MTAVQLLTESGDERDALPVLMSAPLCPGCDIARIFHDTAIRWDLLPAYFATTPGAAMSRYILAVLKTHPFLMPCARFSMRGSMSISPVTVRGLSRPGCAERPTGPCAFFDFVKSQLALRSRSNGSIRLLVDRYAGSLRRAGLRPVAAAALLRDRL